MHYIRFLKSPRLLPVPSPRSLTAKITITTDLGESFLSENISLVVDLRYESGASVLGFENWKQYVWKGKDGMRSLEIKVPIPTTKAKRKVVEQRVRMWVSGKEEKFGVGNFKKILCPEYWSESYSEKNGLVMAVGSMAVDISFEARGDKPPGVAMAERRILIGIEQEHTMNVSVWEEIGESIARHIWDAGLVLSAYLADLSIMASGPVRVLPQLPVLEKLMQRKHVLEGKQFNALELGAGCGIVGITLAACFPLLSKILLTDLPEASEIIENNLSFSTVQSHPSKRLGHQVLDWASPLPPNVTNTKWDLVVVADCTYNPDVVPDLVQTLRSLAKGNQDMVVLLAMKVRHESEMVFFELMDHWGFGVKEKCKIPLPLMGGEDEEIEIFIFGYRG